MDNVIIPIARSPVSLAIPRRPSLMLFGMVVENVRARGYHYCCQRFEQVQRFQGIPENFRLECLNASLRWNYSERYLDRERKSMVIKYGGFRLQIIIH